MTPTERRRLIQIARLILAALVEEDRQIRGLVLEEAFRRIVILLKPNKGD